MTENRRGIYLDNNATTLLHPKVIARLEKEMGEILGNPSSTHRPGQEIRTKLVKARKTLASYLKVLPEELTFTSGGTESINTVLRSFFQESAMGHLITSSVEHSAVYENALFLQKRGVEVTFLAPGEFGAVQRDQVEKAITPNTRLIALMAANNETGVRTDVEAIAKLAEEKRIPFFVDGVALLGKEKFLIPRGVSMMSFSGHKLHAPSGIGMTFIRKAIQIPPLLLGGEQEAGRRAGSENTLGIFGLETAVQVLQEDEGVFDRIRALRNYFEEELKQKIHGLLVNGVGPRICNTSNLYFPGADGESLLMNLDLKGVYASHGSACAAGSLEPSRVLLNMGYPIQRVASSLRFSLSRTTTKEDLDKAIKIILDAFSKVRS